MYDDELQGLDRLSRRYWPALSPPLITGATGTAMFFGEWCLDLFNIFSVVGIPFDPVAGLVGRGWVFLPRATFRLRAIGRRSSRSLWAPPNSNHRT